MLTASEASNQVQPGLASNVYGDPVAGRLLLHRTEFQIRVADGPAVAESQALMERMYSWRGYKRSVSSRPNGEEDEITLQACRNLSVFGTLTVRFGSAYLLNAEELYPDEINVYRQSGATVAELTRLAVDPVYGSKEVLGALFHAAYVCLGPLRQIDDIFIEVHPRHVAFYRRMLGFRAIGACKMSPRVAAPAVLMHVPIAYVGRQAALYGGRASSGNRSLYPYFSSEADEQLAMRRLSALGLRGTNRNLPSDLCRTAA